MRTATVFSLLLILLTSQAAFAVPTYQWAQRSGGTGADTGSGVAFDASGNVLVVGTYGDIAFASKYNASGTQLWSKLLGQGRAYGVATDLAGNVLVIGAFGIYPTEAANPQTSIFILKLDPNGVQQWVRTFGTPGGTYDEGIGVATDASGNVVTTGRFLATVDFGGGPLASAGHEDIFIAKFSAGGNHVWSHRAGSATYREYGMGITVDGLGNVIVTGTNNGPVDFGGGVLPYGGALDIFLVKYAADGTHLWSHSYGGTRFDDGIDVACDAADNIVMVGRFGGSANFGGGVLASVGEGDIVLAKYNASGAHQWSKRFGSVGYSTGSGIAVDPSNNIFIAGSFPGTIDFGGGALTSGDPYASDILVAKFDAGGGHLWSQDYGPDASSSERATAVAINSTGDLAVTGDLSTSVNFGGGPLASAGHEDIFLAKFFAESPVPVLISSFGAALAGDGVHLQWKLESDENISGFNVYRTQADSKSVRIAELSGSVASYIDASIRAGMSYTYLLGVRTGSGEVVSQAATVRIPLASVTLGQNHPNPFNPVTTIEYSVQDRSDVVIGVYNSSGELVTRLNEGPRESGLHRVQWNGRNLAGQLVASGAYFYRLEGSSAPARKMILLK